MSCDSLYLPRSSVWGGCGFPCNFSFLIDPRKSFWFSVCSGFFSLWGWEWWFLRYSHGKAGKFLSNSRDGTTYPCVVSSFIGNSSYIPWGLPQWLNHKEPTCQCRRCRFDLWVGKFLWKRKWQPNSVFLPEKSHGQRSLVDDSPCVHKRVRHELASKQQQQMT